MKNPKLASLILTLSIGALLVGAFTSYLFPDASLAKKVFPAIFAVGLITYLVLQKSSIVQFFGKRTTQFGVVSIASCLMALAALIVLNTIVAEYDVKLDFTKNKLHTLSEQTVKVLKNLKSDVTLKVFVAPTQIPEFEKVIDKYTYESAKVKKDFVDVDKDPLVLQKYNIRQAGVMVVESETRSSRVDNLHGADDPKIEEKITNAIISVAKGEKKKVYFISGHGERLFSDSSREGYSELKEALEASRYTVHELILADKDKMPTDAEIVVCAGPKSDFLGHELSLLEGYLKKGGKALFMLEPLGSSSLKGLLSKYGVEWKAKRTVVETNPLQQLAGGNPLTPIVTNYSASHEITQDSKQMSIFAISSPLEKSEKLPEGLAVESLFSTSARAMEAEIQGSSVKVNEKNAKKGPFALAFAISGKVGAPASSKKPTDSKTEKPEADAKEQEFRMIVVGDSDFASNSLRRFGINADLFQNMMSWLSKEEDLIAIHPKATDTSQFDITEQNFRVIHLASVWVMPPLLILAGIGVFLSRRRM